VASCSAPDRPAVAMEGGEAAGSGVCSTPSSKGRPPISDDLRALRKCEVCHRFDISYTLGCGHGACRWCALTLHGCGVCGEPVVKRTTTHDSASARRPRLVQPSPSASPAVRRASLCRLCHGKRDTAVEVVCDNGCTIHCCGACLATVDKCIDCGANTCSVNALPTASDIMSAAAVTPVLEVQSRPLACQICENRPHTVHLHCRSGCTVLTCGACAQKHRKCFMCGTKVVQIDEISNDQHMASQPRVGCDVCKSKSRVYLLNCKKGCCFRVCSRCNSFMKTCCGQPILSGTKILGTSPAMQPIDWRDSMHDKFASSPVGARKRLFDVDSLTSTLHAFEFVNGSTCAQSHETLGDRPSSSDNMLNRTVESSEIAERYLSRLQRAAAVEAVLEPLIPDGGFMGYSTSATTDA